MIDHINRENKYELQEFPLRNFFFMVEYILIDDNNVIKTCYEKTLR